MGAPGGTFVSKVFRSRDYDPLLQVLKLLFDKVNVSKPAASRHTSAEIFVLCLCYKAPSRIDPALLDRRVLFNHVENPRKMSALNPIHEIINNREGYATCGVSAVWKPIPAVLFICSDAPLDILNTFTQIVLEGPGS